MSGLAGACNNLGLSAWYQRDLDTAYRVITESHSLIRGKGNRRYETIMTVNLAFLATRVGRLDDGRAHLDVALQSSRELGDRTDTVTGALLCAAELATAEGRWRDAAHHFGASEALLEGMSAFPTSDQPYWHEHDSCVRRVREALGPSIYDDCSAAGRAASVDDAVERAIAELSR